MTRSEIWLAQVGRKSRPVLVLTRAEVIEVRTLITVAEVTTSIRGLAAEVGFDAEKAGLSKPSVINCDGVHTVSRSSLTSYVGTVPPKTIERVCQALKTPHVSERSLKAVPRKR